MRAPWVALMLTVMAASAVFALYHKVAVGEDTVRFVSPRKGEALGGDSVTVRYRLNHRLANASSVSYELRLDDNTPVRTEKTDYTFSQLSPGWHQIHVRVQASSNKELSANTVSFSTSAVGGQGELPETGSALPLLSVIGFGVLLGGVASALRTR